MDEFDESCSALCQVRDFFNGCGCERVMRYDLEDPGEIKSFDRI